MEKEFDIRLCVNECKKAMKVIYPCIEEVMMSQQSFCFDEIEVISDCLFRLYSLKEVIENVNLSNDDALLFVLHFYNELLIILNIINMHPRDFLDLTRKIVSLSFLVSEVNSSLSYCFAYSYVKQIMILLDWYSIDEFDELGFYAIDSPDGEVDMYVIRCGTEFFHTSVQRLVDKDFMLKDLFEENR